MFVTEPHHEVTFPAILGADSTRYWRAVRLSLHAIWFVLTVEIADGDLSFVRTACIAKDLDLVDVLENLRDARPRGLLCMLPGRCSPTGLWTAREVGEVWVATTPSEERVVILHDQWGGEFGDQIRARPGQDLSQRRLIVRLRSPARRSAQHPAD